MEREVAEDFRLSIGSADGILEKLKKHKSKLRKKQRQLKRLRQKPEQQRKAQSLLKVKREQREKKRKFLKKMKK
mgnify:CR=1 FL=1